MPPGNYTPVGSNPNVLGNVAPYALPLPEGTPPIPMVVTSTLFGGAPASAYPIWNSGATYGGLVTADPTYNFILGSSKTAATGIPPQYTNALKAAWIQFLSLRHGGSGYMFGFGNGAVGQNVTVAGLNAIPGANGATSTTNPIPAEIPFHSLSYPDIDHTVMRPAALPPGVSGVSGGTPTFYTVPNAHPPLPTVTAAALYGTAFPAAANPWNNPLTYGQINTALAAPASLWNTFVGDPGVRNFWLYSGYPSAFLAANSAVLPAHGLDHEHASELSRGYPGYLMHRLLRPRRERRPRRPNSGQSFRRRSRRGGSFRLPMPIAPTPTPCPWPHRQVLPRRTFPPATQAKQATRHSISWPR